MDNVLKGKIIKNDVVDEVFELEEDEEILQKREILNQPIDAEVVVSDDSQNYIPTPQEEMSLMQENPEFNLDNKLQEKIFMKSSLEKANHDQYYESKANKDSFVQKNKILKEISNLKLRKASLAIFSQYSNFDTIISELKIPLKPFIPEFIPTVGEIEAFLKPSRPDSLNETLGLEKLDEPAFNTIKQSYLDLLFKEFYKGKAKHYKTEIHSIKNPSQNKKAVQSWIRDVGNLNHKKHSAAVLFSRPMPEIDSLMQAPETDIEASFKKVLPFLKSHNLPMSTNQLARLSCSLMDIPVHSESSKSLVESLNVLFTLYTAFTSNEHFQNIHKTASHEVERMEFS